MKEILIPLLIVFGIIAFFGLIIAFSGVGAVDGGTVFGGSPLCH
jgi:hypothetical protein